jgi:hypothetical protein
LAAMVSTKPCSGRNRGGASGYSAKITRLTAPDVSTALRYSG